MNTNVKNHYIGLMTVLGLTNLLPLTKSIYTIYFYEKSIFHGTGQWGNHLYQTARDWTWARLVDDKGNDFFKQLKPWTPCAK